MVVVWARNPSDPSTISKPGDQEVGEVYAVQGCRAVAFKALKLRKGRSGSERGIYSSSTSSNKETRKNCWESFLRGLGKWIGSQAQTMISGSPLCLLTELLSWFLRRFRNFQPTSHSKMSLSSHAVLCYSVLDFRILASIEKQLTNN